MNQPLVSVVVPVFNAQQYLAEAIKSIFNQSYKNFELLVFNDGSTDQSLRVLRSFSDDRIRLFESKENRGYIYHLNKGLELAKGKYIARMDADDISLPERFERQVALMEQNPGLGVCGTWFESFNEGGKLSVTQYPVDDAGIRLMLFYQNAFCHPSVMLRAAVLKQNGFRYEADVMPAEDYHLWVRLAAKAKLANVPEVLFRYRMHEENISYKEAQKKDRFTIDIISAYFSNMLDLQLSGSEVALYRNIAYSQFKPDRAYVEEVECLLLKIWEANNQTRYLPKAFFDQYVAERWYHICTNSTILGLWAHRKYISARLPKVHISHPQRLKLFLKSLIGYKGVKA